jgi:hypothetical protein
MPPAITTLYKRSAEVGEVRSYHSEREEPCIYEKCFLH